MITSSILDDGSTVTQLMQLGRVARDQRQKLGEEFTSQDVKNALQASNDDKASCMHGYTPLFFKYALDVMGGVSPRIIDVSQSALLAEGRSAIIFRFVKNFRSVARDLARGTRDAVRISRLRRSEAVAYSPDARYRSFVNVVTTAIAEAQCERKRDSKVWFHFVVGLA
ncbi:hypothetical protein Dimus_000145 [Dionaea muscipula]